MATIPSLALNDGRWIPQLGLGVYKTPKDETAKIVECAFELGYRHVDTAAIYGNEAGVGAAVASCGLPRQELYITTKLWNADQGYDSAKRAFDTSLKQLKLDYVDLYLIHWPRPRQNLFVDSWKALIELQQAGQIKSIGVSNFRAEDLERLDAETGVVPAVNQIELHPLLQQASLRAVDAAHGIISEAWSPLAQGGDLLKHPKLEAIGRKYGKTAAQVILRWHIQLGLVVIPKSAAPARIKTNSEIFDFELDEAELEAITALDEGRRLGPDPASYE